MKKHILIVNQHGENRGDEAAMRAMLSGLENKIQDVEFTLLYQFRDHSLKLNFEQEVEALPIVLPLVDYIRLLIFTFFKYIFRYELLYILSPTHQSIIKAYKRTDLVISAPGGPYFGDIYANHEIVHWWYILLGDIYRKPLLLYATSAGPFNIKSLNIIRRWLYPKFDKLIVREDISANHIKKLLGKKIEIEITADSAIQQSFPAKERSEYFKNGNSKTDGKLLVAVVLNDYKYPKSKNPKKDKEKYNAEITKTLKHLISKHNAYILFIPQLYGKIHNDYIYMEKIASYLPKNTWELVDQAYNSDEQRKIFAMCDIHFASRYHPAIFGNTSFTPGLCLYYEHKALGFMQQIKLEKYAIDIRDIQSKNLNYLFDDLIENRKNLCEHLKNRIPLLKKRSKRTTDAAIELLCKSNAKAYQ